ncbi:uncharacterized protein L201_006728 [Kwoniella dendrophila CBS 6074]|uniref:Uncharacterized protein n=1 Tax=Kwoniella dendrophila CBS 6074 TaxID=1295534 RepID=A0AAX4K251_9TREE
MAVSDAVKIAVIVSSPIVFFALLFLGAYSYRRHHSPAHKSAYSHDNSHNIGQPFSPTQSGEKKLNESQKQNVFDNCQSCSQDRKPITQPRIIVTSTPNTAHTFTKELQWDDNADRQSEVKHGQPHFEEKQISIRRISSNSSMPDTITRVNSFCSSLGHANASSDVLGNYAGQRQSSIATTDQPLDIDDVLMSLAPNVINVGQRRPSVLSGGSVYTQESDKLSIRKISAGGKEDLFSVGGSYGTADPIKFSTHSAHTIDKPHPFSAAALNRNSYFPRTDSHNQFPFIQVQKPPKATIKHKSKPRPEILKIPSVDIPSTSTISSDRTYVGSDDALFMPTATSIKAIKSATTPKGEVKYDIEPALDTSSSFGHEPLQPYEKPKFFEENWNGFKGNESGIKKQEDTHSKQENTIIPYIEIPISPTTPVTAAKRQKAGSRKGTPSAAFARLNSRSDNSKVKTEKSKADEPNLQVNTTGDNSDDKRSSKNPNRITYLADTVKENKEKQEEQKRLSAIKPSETQKLEIPQSGLTKGTSIVSEKPPTLSPLRMEHGLGVGILVGTCENDQVVNDREPRAV